MAIYGITGGIGSGKTMTGMHLLLEDLEKGRQIFTNAVIKNVPKEWKERIHFVNKDIIKTIFQRVKDKEIDMRNATVFLQEMHNYIDSRNSMSVQNRMISYWILQSRHTGEGSCDIIYDTQDGDQVDKRLRKNTDFHIMPYITQREHVKNRKEPVPKTIFYTMEGKIGHRMARFSREIDVTLTRDRYDTHELVDF